MIVNTRKEVLGSFLERVFYITFPLNTKKGGESVMTRSTKIRRIIVGLLVLVLALLVAFLWKGTNEPDGVIVNRSAPVAATSDDVVTQKCVTVKKLDRYPGGYPQIEVTTTCPRLGLLFVPPNVPAGPNEHPFAHTKSIYSMPKKLKPGETVTWEIHAYNLNKGTEPFFHLFTWTRPVAELSSSWDWTPSWTKIANPIKKCPKGRVYTFELRDVDGVSYLAAESTLELRLKRSGGKIVTRYEELAFGDGPLVWMPRVAPKTKVMKATVSVSGESRGNMLPPALVEFACVGS